MLISFIHFNFSIFTLYQNLYIMKKQLLSILLFAGCVSIGYSQIPEEGLVGYYKLDDGTYVDSSPSGVDLEEVDLGGFLLPVADRFDQPDKALKIINQYLDTASNPGFFDFSDDSMMSISVWMKIDQTVIDWTAVVNNWGGFGLGGYYLGLTPSQQVRWNVNTEPVIDSDPVPTGEWMHIVATYDGNISTLYIDGVQIASEVLGVTLEPSAYTLTVGTQADLPTNIFPGIVDDVLMYNRALTSQEVQDIFNTQPLSIGDVDALSQKIVIAPNPVEETFTFSFDQSLGSLVSYTISDVKGSVIVSKTIEDLNQMVDVSTLEAGMYLLTFTTNNQVEVTKRLIKK